MKDTIERLRTQGWKCECAKESRCVPCALVLAGGHNAELKAALQDCLQFVCFANYELDPHWEPVRDKAYASARAAVDRLDHEGDS